MMRLTVPVVLMAVLLVSSAAVAAKPEVWTGYATLQTIGDDPPSDDSLRRPQPVRLKFRPGVNGKMTCRKCFSVCKNSPFRSSQPTYGDGGRLASLTMSSDCSSPLLSPSAPGPGLPFALQLDCVAGRLVGSYNLLLDPSDAPFIVHTIAFDCSGKTCARTLCK
jgi:hypothetical protein